MADVTAAQRPDLLEQARDELGVDPFAHVDEGTHLAQPAIYCASLAHWKRAGSPAAEIVRCVAVEWLAGRAEQSEAVPARLE